MGILPTILATVGGLFLLKKGENKGILILIWALSILLLSRAYYLGFNIIPIRVLEVASYPLIIMAGYGLAITLDFIYNKLNPVSSAVSMDNNEHKIHIEYFKKNIKLVLLLSLGVLTLTSGVVFADGYTPNLVSQNDVNNSYIFSPDFHLLFNPLDSVFNFELIADRYGNLNLAYDREGVVEWFIKNGDPNKTVWSTDSIMDTIIVSTSGVHVIKGGYSEDIPINVVNLDTRNYINVSREQLLKDNVEYLLLRNGMQVPSYAHVVYRNGYYIICVIN